MSIHSKTTTNLKNVNDIKVENSILDKTTNSKRLDINHSMSNFPLYNGNTIKNKLSESEAKISKLVSEIDLLKNKVS